jgi:ATP-binding cassette subfamily B protein RaxB
MINLPSSYFESRHFGDVVSRFCSQTQVPLGFGMLLLLRTMVSAMRGWMVIVLGAIRAKRVTRVIVAHRPETIRSADRVINLDEVAGHAVAHRPALPAAGRAVGPAGPAAQIGSI